MNRNNVPLTLSPARLLTLYFLYSMTTATYLELYAPPSTRFSRWWETCRTPCALLSQNATALCLQANVTQPVSNAIEPMSLPQTV